MVGAASALAWVMLTGLVINLVAVAAVARPTNVSAATIGWMMVAGAGNVSGLLLAYLAVSRGKVGLVAPIISTEGAIAAVLAVLAGESMGTVSALLLAVIVGGVALAAAAPEDLPVDGENKSFAVAAAAAAAACFGLNLFAVGHISGSLPLPWVLLPPRLLGVLVLTIPLALSRRLRLTRRALPLVLVGGLCEVMGTASYTLGARHSIAVAAVLVSQFAAIATVAAYLLFGERLTKMQLAGVVTVIAGVAALSVVRA